jgi:hypothetical protein
MTMNPTEAVSSERLRQVTWTIWLVWVLVSALIPVFSTIVATALGKPISPTAEKLALIGFAALAPPIMQALVLKRVLPKLSVWVWFFCILLSDILWPALPLALLEAGPGPLTPSRFYIAALLQISALDPDLIRWANAMRMPMPWEPVLLLTVATSTLMSLVPTWVLGIASGRRRATFLFLAASIVGAFASTIVELLPNMIVDEHVLRDWAWALDDLSWTERFRIVAIRAGVGAVWGATTATFVLLMIRRWRIQTC